MISLRRMIVLSVIFHGVLFAMLVVSSFAWQRRDVMPIVHPVELVSLPRGEISRPEPVPAKKPEPVSKKAPEVRKEDVDVKKAKRVPEPPVRLEPAKKKAVKVVKEKEPPRTLQTRVDPREHPAEEKGEKAASKRGEKSEQQEASLQTPGVPDVMPVLQRPYSEYEFYHALIGREIRKRWAPPPVSLKGQRMETVVGFSISRTGRIDGPVTVEKSSGNLFYDQAALRATLGPLPPPPLGYPEELLKMRLIYVLDQSRPN